MGALPLKYLHVRMICGALRANDLSGTVFTGEIETTRIMIARRDIRGSIQNAIRTMRQQGELLIAALVVVQIEGDPDTDPAQFDYRAGAYTELVAASGRRRAAGHIIELLKHETE